MSFLSLSKEGTCKGMEEETNPLRGYQKAVFICKMMLVNGIDDMLSHSSAEHAHGLLIQR